jgi:metallo-beta-lactamase family protein
MYIVPHGAAGGEVTGSAYAVHTRQARLLVDCGLFQGGRGADALNRTPGERRVDRLDAVLLTHAHLDHVGRLPLLARLGYTGPVYATPATLDMAKLVLRDAARVQEFELARRNRQRLANNLEPQEPLYTKTDVEHIIRLFRPVPYREPVPLAPGITGIWLESGHMLGSACIQLRVEEDGRTRTVVFSGDLGPLRAPLLKDFETFSQADAVFLESTYGDRDHRPFKDTVSEFMAIVTEAVAQRGRILVPTFAIGRAQLLTMLLAWMFRNKKVARFPVYLDSPMAVEASKIMGAHTNLLDAETHAFARAGNIKADLRTMKAAITAAESQRITRQPGPCLVMAGAGMCNAGRILHHLKHGLWLPQTHVVIVGYQAAGSLGRKLLEGASTVRIHGNVIRVKAKIHSLGGFSAHAGQTDLLKWFAPLARAKPKIFLTHGEDRARQALAEKIREQFHLEAEMPALRTRLEL